MADNYGEDMGANRAIQDCGWETPLFIPGRPLPGEELSFLGRLASSQDKRAISSNLGASGFFSVGDILQKDGSWSELSGGARSGEVVTSEDFSNNTFYLASGPQGYWVNVAGNLLNLSGTGTLDVHNKIDLNEVMYLGTNLVFLEVWRKAIDHEDTVKKYGNQDTLLNITNDLLGSLGVETARRVQVQYHIRVAPVTTSVHDHLDAFANSVKARAASSNETEKSFTPVEGEPGLFRAGNGGSDASLLGTVDGYCYAVPLLLVYKREEGDFVPNDPNTWNSAPGKEEGKVSTHPSRKFANKIYATDIVDLRHQVLTGSTSLERKAEETFDGILAGHLSTTRGRLGSSLGETGFGGAVIVKADRLGGVDTPERMSALSTGPRGSYVPGRNTQYNNLRKIEPGDWAAGALFGFRAKIALSFLGGSNYSLIGEARENILLFKATGEELPEDSGGYGDYSFSIDEDGYLEVFIGTQPSETLYLKYDLSWDGDGSTGFLDIPDEILQQDFYKGDARHINAVIGSEVLLQGRHPDDTEYYSAEDRIELKTGNVTNSVQFGQVATLYRTATAGEINYVIELDEEDCLPGSGQKVIGLRSIRFRTVGGDFYEEYTTDSFTINEVTHVLTVTASEAPTATEDLVEITLHLGTKFSVCSREARGVLGTYETALIDVTESGGEYTGSIQTSFILNKHVPTIANLCTMLKGSVSSPTEEHYVLSKAPGEDAWESDTVTVGQKFPYMDSEAGRDTLPSQVRLTDIPSSVSGRPIKVGVHMYSWYRSDALESVTFTYNTRGYQGILGGGEKEGDIVVQGPAIITTRGSYQPLQEGYPFLNATIEEVSDKTYNFIIGKTIPEGQILPGDYLRVASSPKWKTLLLGGNPVVSVTPLNNEGLQVTFMYTLDATEVGASVSGSFIRPGSSLEGFYNPIGRMPSSTMNDHLYDGEGNLKGAENFLKTKASNLSSNIRGVKIGTVPTGYKGQYNVQVLKEAGVSPLDTTKTEWFLKYFDLLGETGLPAYKILQSFVFKEKGTGRLYLGVLSSSYTSGESAASTSPYEGQDVVDLFELKGRPLTGADYV